MKYQISLTEKLDRNNSKVDIIDFSYDIFEENFWIVKQN